MTDKFYDAVMGYVGAHNTAEDECRQEMEQLVPYEGSSYYLERMQAAAKARDSKIDAARKEAAAEITDILQTMNDNLLKHPMVAPSSEQINLLTALKMRESVTDDELNQAAVSMSGCPAALAVVREIARRNGTMLHNVYGAEMDVGAAQEVVQALRRGTDRLLNNGGRFNSPAKLAGADKVEVISRLAGLPMRVRENPNGTQEAAYNADMVKVFAELVD